MHWATPAPHIGDPLSVADPDTPAARGRLSDTITREEPRIDPELLARAREGDKEARTEILRRCEPQVQSATANENERHELRVAVDTALASWVPEKGELVRYARAVRKHAAQRERERAHSGREIVTDARDGVRR